MSAFRSIRVRTTLAGGGRDIADELRRLAPAEVTIVDDDVNDDDDVPAAGSGGAWTGELVVIGDPAAVLADALQDDTVPDRLQQWVRGAEEMRRHLQRRRSLCVVVDVDAARSSFASLVGICAERWMIDFATPTAGLPSAAPDPLRLAVATALVAQDPAAPALRDELRLHCTALCEAQEATAARSDDGARSIERLRALEATELAWSRAAGAHGDVERRLVELHAELGAQRARGERASAEAARSRQAVVELREARSENQLLLLQLQQAFDERERQQQLLRKAVAGDGEFAFADIVLSGLRDEPPHRELSFVVRQLRLRGHTFPGVGMRLVEHHGRVGVAIFAARAREQPFVRWVESGREGEVPYMLLVPADTPTRRQLDGWSTLDWRVLVAVAHGIAAELAGRQDMAPRWLVVARRLALQLEGLPPSVRWDAVRVAAADGPHAWTLAFDGVTYGSRRLGQLHVRWSAKPAAGKPAQLQFTVPPGDGTAALPLANWPVAAHDGSIASEVTLRFGDGIARSDKQVQWSRLDEVDRAFVLALLRALPGAVAAAAARPAAELDAESRDLVADARAAIDGSRVQRIARSLMRLAPVRRSA